MELQQLQDQLFRWWRQKGRVLPWRTKWKVESSTTEDVKELVSVDVLRERAFTDYFAASLLRDPYHVVVAELMLQQTQVDRVLPKYEAWMAKWPSLSDLAESELAEVLIFWQGLGYNRRARFLWLLAKEIVGERQGVWPTTEKELRELPGIGQYTARALLSFAFGQQVGVVDTNVKRVVDRIFGGLEPPARDYFSFVNEVLPHGQADPWNQALMDFGALICTAKSPKCESCPVANLCKANQAAVQKGFANFAEYLKTSSQTSTKKTSIKPKLKFADTDRYFRGRIMDELRAQSHSVDQLAKLLTDNYGLADRDRFHRLLKNLEAEGLLTRDQDQVRIG